MFKVLKLLKVQWYFLDKVQSLPLLSSTNINKNWLWKTKFKICLKVCGLNLDNWKSMDINEVEYKHKDQNDTLTFIRKK